MSVDHITDERILSAVRLGDNTVDRLAETFDVPFSCFTLRRKLLALRDAGLLAEAGSEGGQTVWAVPVVRRRAA